MEKGLTKLTRAEMLNMFHLLAALLGFQVIMEQDTPPAKQEANERHEENVPPQDKCSKMADANEHALKMDDTNEHAPKIDDANEHTSQGGTPPYSTAYPEEG